MIKSELSAEFPEKERRAVRVAQSNVDENIRKYIEKIAQQRAPWFVAGVKEISWCTDVVFEHRVAKSFGHGRVWLAGDSAHQTGPIGAQSMNVGILEADSLIGKLRNILRDNTALATLESYNEERSKEWQSLLGMTGGLQPGKTTPPWVAERCGKLLSCIPGSGEEVVRLAGQLGLTVAK
jgi:2-polyprenyl-6-methoxyphenol hydroxylase-like FAD-dependent oxidoreductase